MISRNNVEIKIEKKNRTQSKHQNNTCKCGQFKMNDYKKKDFRRKKNDEEEATYSTKEIVHDKLFILIIKARNKVAKHLSQITVHFHIWKQWGGGGMYSSKEWWGEGGRRDGTLPRNYPFYR